jgi:hypothetical protein
MEAICFSESSVDFQRTTLRYIPEGDRHELCPHVHVIMLSCFCSQYSFVTPLTSLVVVKPNENASSVNTEDVSDATHASAPTGHAHPGKYF